MKLDNSISGCYTNSDDVTETVLARKKIEESEQSDSVIVIQCPSKITHADAAGNVISLTNNG
jgi:hypothetical protein